jgi:hypothetical protein
MRIRTAWTASFMLLVPLLGCGPGEEEPPPPEPGEAVEIDELLQGWSYTAQNTLTEGEEAEGWRLLFDGETTAGWRGFRRRGMSDGWRVEDGALTRAAPAGDIITEEQFGNFELSLEWRISPGGNSGIFIRATEESELIYHGAPEMQILDDGAFPGLSPLHAAGSNYDLHPVPVGVTSRPAFEWNQVRIRVEGGRVEQWMNGQLMVRYELWSPDWEERVRNSKFVEWPEYGRARMGHIGLQDHGDRVWFRNIKIREMP